MAIYEDEELEEEEGSGAFDDIEDGDEEYVPLDSEGSADDLFEGEEDNTDYMNSVSSNNDIYNEGHRASEEEVRKSKKVMIFGLIAGVLLIIFAAMFSSAFVRARNNKAQKKQVEQQLTQQQTMQQLEQQVAQQSVQQVEQPVQQTIQQPVQQVVEQQQVVQQPVVESSVQSQPVISQPDVQKEGISVAGDNRSSTVEVVNMEDPNYVPFEVGYYGEQSGAEEAILNISEIKGYLINRCMLEYYVQGNIEGMDGVYRVNVGYDIANKLKVGDRLKVYIRKLNVDGSVMISSVEAG